MEQTVFDVRARVHETAKLVILKVPASSHREAAALARAQGWYVDAVAGDEPDPGASEPQSAMLARPVRTVAYGVVVGHLLLILIAFAVFTAFVLIRAVAH